MFGWLKKRVIDKSRSVQLAELQDWVRRLDLLDPPELGFQLGMTAHGRKTLERIHGYNLLYPSAVVLADPLCSFHVVQTIKSFQKENAAVFAAGFFPWAFTLRAASDIELRPLTRILWKKLASGIDHTQRQMIDFEVTTGVTIEFDEFWLMPDGFNPLSPDWSLAPVISSPTTNNRP